jgi:serine/threonine protein kinase
MPRAKAGESVRGYKLLKDFKMAGGGNCEWTFAVKDGKEYFIKVFLNPKYPRPDGPGSAEVKRMLIEECEKFEKHQRELNDAVKKVAGADGRLVAAADFFREENLFYKVAHKVPAKNITAAEIARLPLPSKIRLLQNVSTAVTSLHRQNIVHGDLKVDNALLEEGTGDNPFIARLIDFDSSYFSGKPYDVDEMVGDPPYYSPELLDYVQKRETDATKLTTQSDVFALGIVFHQYLVGEAPPFPDDYQYLCEAVRAGHIVTSESLGEIGSPSLAELLSSMMRLKASDRPSSFVVQNALRDIRVGKDVTPKPLGGTVSGATAVRLPPTPAPPPAPTEARKGLRGKLVEKTGEIAKPTVSATGSSASTIPDTKSTGVGGSSPVEIKKGALKISLSGSSETPKSGAETPITPTTSRPAESTASPSPAAPGADLALPGTYRVMLTQLISNLAALDEAVAVKQTPPEAPPRVKGSLRHAPRSLSTEEVETLSDIAEHLEELQRHAGLVVSWFSGESTERPALLSGSSDLVVESSAGSEGVRMEVDGASVRADLPSGSVTEPAPATPKDIDDVPAVPLSATPVIESSEISETPAVVVPVSASADKPAETSSEVAVPPRDVSGGHRRAERLKNRDAGPRS